MAELTDLELLSSLQVALAPRREHPDEEALTRLQATLQELESQFEPVDIAAAAQRRIRQRTVRARRGARSSIVAASALAFALTAGVAAAAVATNTLPGPTRAFAYDVGLPVTSPALYGAQRSVAALRHSILAKNLPQEKTQAQQLIGQLKTLDPSDLSQIRATADQLLTAIGVTLPNLPSASSSPKTPTITIPSVSVPTATVPNVTVPSVSVPSVSVPSVSVPSVSVPSITTPVGTVPSVSIPSAVIPKVTIPSIPLPVVTIPIVHLPGLP
jgi:hypothetical protein